MGYPPQNEAYVLRPDIYAIISGNVTLLSRTLTLVSGNTSLLTRTAALVSGNLTLLSGNTALLSRTATLVSGNTDLLTNTAAMFHHIHSRSRVYPQDTQLAITLACAATADTWGSWTQIVPINTIDFEYMPAGVVIEGTNAASTYCIQLGFSIVDTDPTTAQIMGERRIKLAEVPIKIEHDYLNFFSDKAPANAKLWGRAKADSGAADEIYISVVVIRHMPITNPIPQLTTWPWST